MRRNTPSGLDYERLHAWHLAVALAQRTHRLVQAFPSGGGSLADQLRRSCTSVVLNIAEGASARTDKEKVHKFAIARSEAGETSAGLELAVQLGWLGRSQTRGAQDYAKRVVAATTGLIRVRGGLPDK